jgi:L-asparaginase II
LSRFPHLVKATRGHADRYETRHAGVISVVDGTGKEIASAGDTDVRFPLRSTSKPFQLLPYLLDGLHRTHPRGAEELAADLAVMMSSHGGEPMHTARVAAILEASGLTAESLQCGAHWPYHPGTRNALLRAGRTPTALHSNCSGKHTGMLAVCKYRGWSLAGYTNPEHPIQRRIHDIVSSLSCEISTPLPMSIDGCSLPTYWVSTRGLARMYAVLAYPATAALVENRETGALLEILFAAGTKHPEMIGGTDRFDTRMMQGFTGRLFAKSGAAGMYAMSVAPCASFPSGIGIAFKIEDGDFDNRVRPVVACEILRQLGVTLPDPAVMAALANATIRNVRDLETGEYRSVFQLS